MKRRKNTGHNLAVGSLLFEEFDEVSRNVYTVCTRPSASVEKGGPGRTSSSSSSDRAVDLIRHSHTPSLPTHSLTHSYLIFVSHLPFPSCSMYYSLVVFISTSCSSYVRIISNSTRNFLRSVFSMILLHLYFLTLPTLPTAQAKQKESKRK